jgi:excisionase family DNA binding protein
MNDPAKGDETPSRFMDMQELAHLLQVPESTAYKLNRQKRIPGVVRFGRHYRFERAKIEAWLERGAEAS